MCYVEATAFLMKNVAAAHIRNAKLKIYSSISVDRHQKAAMANNLLLYQPCGPIMPACVASTMPHARQ
jgi:hypothetical protein